MFLVKSVSFSCKKDEEGKNKDHFCESGFFKRG